MPRLTQHLTIPGLDTVERFDFDGTGRFGPASRGIVHINEADDHGQVVALDLGDGTSLLGIIVPNGELS